MSNSFLPFSIQNALFDAAHHLQKQEDAEALKVLDKALPPSYNKGRITSDQLADIYKIMFEDIALATSDYVLEEKNIQPEQDVYNIKANALTRLVKDSMVNLLSSVTKQTDFTSAYSVSIPLLAASFLEEKEQYQVLKEKMIVLMGNNKNPWLLGRMLQAAHNMGDKEFAQKLTKEMEGQLKGAAVDPYSVWARGYLSMYVETAKKDLYAATVQLSQQKDEAGKDNVPWAVVMNLQSASPQEFEEQVKLLKEFTHTTSVLDALRTIPPSDFRAWAISLTLQAAKRVNNQEVYNELKGHLNQEIEESPSKGDQLLATLIRLK